MSDEDFCIEHGRDFMRCDRGPIPYCKKCEGEQLGTKCELCGEPMPPGEEMFKYHGHSGDCPKPPLRSLPTRDLDTIALETARLIDDIFARHHEGGRVQRTAKVQVAVHTAMVEAKAGQTEKP